MLELFAAVDGCKQDTARLGPQFCSMAAGRCGSHEWVGPTNVAGLMNVVWGGRLGERKERERGEEGEGEGKVIFVGRACVCSWSAVHA